MHNHRTRFALAAIVAGLAAALGGCGGGSHPSPAPPAARLEHSQGNPAGKIVLTSLGAGRIGLETARAGRVRGPGATIPLAAIIYDPSGKTYAFVAAGRLTYVETPVMVDRIDGGTAYLRRGPRPGARVVSTGAEELYGVQTGVLGQR
jgi:hypothetical protein